MNRQFVVSRFLISGLFIVQTIACSAAPSSPSAPPDESESPDTKRDWEVQTSDNGASFKASEAAQKELGVVRWSVTATEEGRFLEGLDANGAVLGRLEAYTRESGTKLNANLDLNGTKFTGDVSFDGESVKETISEAGAALEKWIGVVGADGKDFLDTHPAPYQEKPSDNCAYKVLQTFLGTVGLFITCRAAKGGGADKKVPCGAGIAAIQALEDSAEKACGNPKWPWQE